MDFLSKMEIKAKNDHYLQLKAEEFSSFAEKMKSQLQNARELAVEAGAPRHAEEVREAKGSHRSCSYW